MIGGVISSFLLELMVYPAIYEVWKARGLRRSAESRKRIAESIAG
jgi:Cu/Ag efflux pump CusA